MAIQFKEYIKEENILEYIDDTVETKLRNLWFWNIVLEFVGTWEGKKATRRFRNAIVEAIEEETDSRVIVYWHKSIRWYEVTFWSQDETEYNERISFYVASIDDPYIRMDYLLEKNVWIQHEQERINRLELGRSEVSSLVENWNDGLAMLKEIHDTATQFELQYQFDIEGR